MEIGSMLTIKFLFAMANLLNDFLLRILTALKSIDKEIG